MARSNNVDLLKGFFSSLAFIAAGLFVRWAGAPAVIVWLAIGMGVLGLAVMAYRVVKPMARPGIDGDAGASGVVLRDGRDYRVDTSDTRFALTDKRSGETSSMNWGDIASVAIIAIDNFPIGGISFILHPASGTSIEVPWDVEGGSAFMNMMQEKLPGFDNMAVVEASGMLHGFKQVWPPERAPEA